MNRAILVVALLKNNLSSIWDIIIMDYASCYLWVYYKRKYFGSIWDFSFQKCSKVMEPTCVKLKGVCVCCLHAVNNCGREEGGLWSSGSGCMVLRCGDGSSLPGCGVWELGASMAEPGSDVKGWSINWLYVDICWRAHGRLPLGDLPPCLHTTTEFAWRLSNI